LDYSTETKTLLVYSDFRRQTRFWNHTTTRVPTVLLITFLTNLYFPKAYRRPDHSIRIAEYHGKIIIIIPQHNIYTETRTQDSLRVCDLSFCNLLAETNNCVLYAVPLSCLASDLQKPSSPGLKPKSFSGLCPLFLNLLVDRNIFGLGDILLSCLVSKIQEPSSPGFEPRTLFRRFDFSEISFWFQRISMPSLVQIDTSVLEL
jgi:hypothetical protein